MPDLSSEAVRSWFAHAAPGLAHLDAHAVRPIERAEPVAGAIARLGATLRTARSRDPAALDATLSADPARRLLRTIMAQLGIHRMVRLIDWLAESPRGQTVLQTLLQADDDGGSQTLRATILELNRQTTIARIFAAGRVDSLLAACQASLDESTAP